MEVVINRQVVIKRPIDGAPAESDFELRTAPLSLPLAAGAGDVVVKNLFLSVDPYQLARMKSFSSSQQRFFMATRIEPGETISALGVGKVLVSGNAEYRTGDVVVGLLGWEEYTVIHPGSTTLTKVDSQEFPLSYHASVLGTSGLTAYVGFYEICKPKKGETVFVSAASGSVGSLVGQYAKLSGCYVVGCSGSKRKVDFLKELGFDDAFNYREEPDLKSALKRYFPQGIDIYFDNVGSTMLEAAVANMNHGGRVAACGAISEYTGGSRRAAPDMLDVIYRRVTVRGFLALDHLDVHREFVSVTSDHLRSGRLQAVEDVSVGIESVPSAFAGLFRGDNLGKKLVRLCD